MEIKVRVDSVSIETRCCNDEPITYKLEMESLDHQCTGIRPGKEYKLVEVDSQVEYVKSDIKLILNSIYGKSAFRGGKVPSVIHHYKPITKDDLKRAVGFFDEIKLYSRVMFHGNATILEIGDFKTVVKCHEDDKFEYHIGLGLALSRYYKKQKSTKKELQTLKHFIKDDNSLAEYCLWQYVGHDTNKFTDLLNKCDEKGKWINL